MVGAAVRPTPFRMPLLERSCSVESHVRPRPEAHLLTSSSGTELSAEDQKWGHGAFTQVLLDAFTGADSDHNGLVSTTELTHYLSAQVPTLTAGAQTPGMEVRYEASLFAAGL
jgi:hypothetical protein